VTTQTLDSTEVPETGEESLPMPRLSLRALALQVYTLDAELTEADGELTPEREARHDALWAAVADKADAMADYLRALDREAAVIKAEEERLAKGRKALEGRRARLTAYTIRQLLAMDVRQLPGALSTLALRPSEVVQVTDEAAVPEEYLRYTTTAAVDKVALKKALKQREADRKASEALAESGAVPAVPALPPIPGAALTTTYTLGLK
jgi:hypothetical protein